MPSSPLEVGSSQHRKHRRASARFKLRNRHVLLPIELMRTGYDFKKHKTKSKNQTLAAQRNKLRGYKASRM